MITSLIIVLVLILIIISICFGVYFVISKKIKNFTLKYFGTDNLKEAIETSEVLASNTPKSLSSMETLSLNQIKKDFPELNINELKSMAEKSILEVLDAIENKKTNNSFINEKVNTWVKSEINDLKDTTVHFDSITFHRTVVNRYENSNGIATIYLQTALEYFYKKDGEIGKKIQDRFKLEYIYIIDSSKVESEKRVLGLNCPNCGAMVTTLGNKVCNYCGSGIKNIVKRNWTLNNILRF